MNNILLLTNVLLLVIGQTIWKVGVTKTPLNEAKDLYNIIFSPWIIAGGILYVLATGIWLYLLSRLPLSYMYPMQSVAYVLGLIISMFIFKEFIPVSRWLGVATIIFGVYLISK
ncbi:EamA family transporter [Paenibacillus sp. Root444D2]|uniref:EamA family transporter n=1 Tax=Paenibacillus sp. Root444D2 TaxID=1736538 RepID=UPI00070E20B4|nr:EamA family transporter [Paenibacillus sp. Root444D2]KQX51922.1 hypothetical protein ASD40_07580 [Paenibacillus sp. Root444D2]